VLNNGKAGTFNPAFTVAYLGSNLPSTKSEFTRGGIFLQNLKLFLTKFGSLDGKNTYSSKRKLRTDMISAPQGDCKHMGHVGMDGAYFGDLSFLGGKVKSEFIITTQRWKLCQNQTKFPALVVFKLH
jgi:activated CDC42 kinase 1